MWPTAQAITAITQGRQQMCLFNTTIFLAIMHLRTDLLHVSSSQKRQHYLHSLTWQMLCIGTDLFAIRASMVIASCLPVWQTGSVMIQTFPHTSSGVRNHFSGGIVFFLFVFCSCDKSKE